MFFNNLASIIREQKAVFLLAIVIIAAGVFMGATNTGLGQSTLEDVSGELQATDFQNLPLVFSMIVTNNVGIAVDTWIAGFMVIPTVIFGIYSVGLPFGIYLNPTLVKPEITLIAFASFGILEFLAMIYAVAAGLMIPNLYVHLLRERKWSVLTETLRSGAILIAYSTITLIISGFLEAFLIYAASTDSTLSLAALVVGVFTSLIYFNRLLKTIGSVRIKPVQNTTF